MQAGLFRIELVALLERLGGCKACFELLPRARVGWHTARTLLPPPPPRSSGAPVRWLMARGRRASSVAAAPRSRAAGAPATRRRIAAGAPWEARARAARVQTAGEDLVVGGWVVVVRTPTPNYLRLASPDRGKYSSAVCARLARVGVRLRARLPPCCAPPRPAPPGWIRGVALGLGAWCRILRIAVSILPPIRGSQPEVIRSECHHHHHHQRSSPAV